MIIPIDSNLSTDSHPNDIKNPTVSRDLFNVNRSYLYNKHLTNAKKQTVDKGGYIATSGEIITYKTNSDITDIYANDRLIASVASLGIEDTVFLDKDDAVIFEESLYTVKKILTGYILERTDLSTGVTVTELYEQNNIIYIRFIRNTKKLIILYTDGSIDIDGRKYDGNNYPEMSAYFIKFNGEFTAIEINKKIYFGYNNPFGILKTNPNDIIDITINDDVFGWSLSNMIPDQNKGYIFNINVADNVKIGAGKNGFALDFMTNILFPTNHLINLTLGENTVISGMGGNGGSHSYNSPITNVLGTTAINSGISININGAQSAIIQGGGDGGALGVYKYGKCGFPSNTFTGYVGGGGGAGLPAGKGGGDGAKDGTLFEGGKGGNNNITNGMDGNMPGTTGNAVRIVSPALITIENVTIRGNVIRI